MTKLETVTYDVSGHVARLSLNRPHSGNAINLRMPVEIGTCVEEADIDPEVRVIALTGVGKGFCSGYDLAVAGAIVEEVPPGAAADVPRASILDPAIQLANHDPGRPWDPMVDYAMMSRNVRGFMSLFRCSKPVVCKIQGFCVGGGTDLALCCDLLVVENEAKIGYPPARVWGVPTTALWLARVGVERTKRLLFTGDCVSGVQAVEWGLAIEAAPADQLDEVFWNLVERIALLPSNQLAMMKLLVNQTLLSQGLFSAQVLATVFDGIARHTREGYAFHRRIREDGHKRAVRERDAPFDDQRRAPAKG